MSSLKKLRKAKSLNDLAFLLGYKPKYLAFILYKIPDDDKYRAFTIPKKNGGVRYIQAPTDRLKKLQKKLAELLYDCADEIKPEFEKLKHFRGKNRRRDRAKKSISHGFHKGLSISSNAAAHIKKKYVFNLDIKNFFPSFNFGRVRGFFMKNDKFKLDPKIATIVAQIACHNNELPQGSPCSPIISNLIAQILDVHLLRLAIKHGCTYTRYADDLTFSTNRKSFPKKIAYKKFWPSKEWCTGKEIAKCMKSSGYEINVRKTHMQYSDSRQIVTGLVVNRVVNTKSEYYRYARAMCHSLFKNGTFTLPPDKSNTLVSNGQNFFQFIWNVLNLIKLASGKTLRPKKTTQDKNVPPPITGTLDQLEGMLTYIYHIKSYRNRFAQSGYRISRHDGNKKPKQDHESHNYPPLNRTNSYSDESHQVAIDGIKNLYAKFLFFKHFYFLSKPLIFCEGKTDIVYLKCALAQLVGSFPELSEKSGTDIKLRVKFFNRTPIVNEMLKLADSTGGMKFTIMGYKTKFKKYSCEGKKHPVIMVVDNDFAGREVLKHCKNFVSGRKISSAHHIVENLYLIELPKVVGSTDTAMEDYFEKPVLDEKLNGKTFNPSNGNIDPKTEYGKDHFAQYVVKARQANIKFDAFEPLLNEITDVVKAHV